MRQISVAIALGLLGCATAKAPPPLPDAAASTSVDMPMTKGDMTAIVNVVDMTAPPFDFFGANAPDLFGTKCVPKTTPCDVFCQDCPSGGKCTLDSTGKPTCVPNGTKALNTQCGTLSNVDDCVAGDICLGDTMKYSSCFQLCATKGMQCSGGGLCDISFTVNGTPAPVFACSEPVTNCDPTSKTVCGAGNGCFFVTSTGKTGCHAAGTLVEGATCTGDYDCLAGSACVTGDMGKTYQCRNMCTLPSGACPAGKSCATINMFPMWGVCV